MIENVQKDVLKLLYPQFKHYAVACIELNCNTLAKRREKLCIKFAKKELKRENSFFTLHRSSYNFRHSKTVEEYNCRTERFYKSSLPYLARLINCQNTV